MRSTYSIHAHVNHMCKHVAVGCLHANNGNNIWITCLLNTHEACVHLIITWFGNFLHGNACEMHVNDMQTWFWDLICGKTCEAHNDAHMNHMQYWFWNDLYVNV